MCRLRFPALVLSKATTTCLVMSGTEPEQELAFPSYWDARYQDYDGDEPSHEWYKSFESLRQVFCKYVLTPKPPHTNPRIIHLGSGDSVGVSHAVFETVRLTVMLLERLYPPISTHYSTMTKSVSTFQALWWRECRKGTLISPESSG